MSNPTTVYYSYRQRVIDDEGLGYVIPLSDGRGYEHPFDHVFDTPAEAKSHLDECIDQELYGDDLNDWDLVLVKVTMEPVQSDWIAWEKVYDGGKCPDCQEPILLDTPDGGSCQNCEFAFFLPRETDDEIAKE